MPRGVRNPDGNGNGRRWGQIVEVEVSRIPPPMSSPWLPLYDDLMLRLERTMPNNGLLVPVPSKADGASAKAALQKLFDRHPGPGAAVVIARTICGETAVYVHRGPAWPK